VNQKSFSRKLLISFLGFALFSLLIIVVAIFSFYQFYRERITREIEVFTTVIAQNVGNFFLAPEEYMVKIRDHIDEYYQNPIENDENSFILDVINLVSSFEEILLVDPEGRVIHTWPYESSFLGLDVTRQLFYSPLQDFSTVQWSNSFISYKSGLPAVSMSLPSAQGRVVAIYSLQGLNRFVSIDFAEADEFIAIIDSKGDVVAHTFTDRALQSENLNNMRSVQAISAGKALIMPDTYNGSRGLVSVHPAKDGFSIVVFRSINRIFGTVQSLFLAYTAVIIVAMAGFLVYIPSMLRSFSIPLQELRNKISIVTNGNYDVSIRSRYLEFNELIDSFTTMVDEIEGREADLKEMVSIKETLLKELNHRTKNNMQVIIAIMNLYDRDALDEKANEILMKIQTRIETISLVHEKLYKSPDISRISLESYITDLVPVVVGNMDSMSDPIKYILDIEDVPILIDFAIPCGLILNELIVNSVKHAFGDQKEKRITIRCHVQNNTTLEMHYCDNGKGLQEDVSNLDSTGMLILHSLAEVQLNGTLKLYNDRGFNAKITLELSTYEDRVQSAL
jgi:two-component sensor histidine kinase